MRTLIGMTDYVLEQQNIIKTAQSNGETFQGLLELRRTAQESIFEYANFLKQPLTLGMFVPCDDFEKPFEKTPDEYESHLRRSYEGGWWQKYYEYRDKYNEAQERVLFEGFKVDYFSYGGGEVTTKSSFQIVNTNGFQACVYKSQPDYFIWNGNGENHPTIENLVKYNLSLTPTALKQIQ